MDYYGSLVLTDTDWIGDAPPVGTTNKPDFSYEYSGKLFSEWDPDTGISFWTGSPPKRNRFEDIKHPARLVVYNDFNHPYTANYPWAHSPANRKGVAAAYADGHAAFHWTTEMDIERWQLVTDYTGFYGWDYYYAGSTLFAIKGYDLK